MTCISKTVLLLTVLAVSAFVVGTFVLDTMTQSTFVVEHPEVVGASAATVTATFGVRPI